MFSYQPVDISLIEPRKRDYSKGKVKAAQVPQEGNELKPTSMEELLVREGKKIKN